MKSFLCSHVVLYFLFLGSALVISVNYKTGIKHPYRLQELHAFLTKSQKQAHLCKMSVDITYAIDILVVIAPYKDYHLETCKDLAVEISDRMNIERNQDETGIFAMLGAATVVKEKATERIENSGIDNYILNE